MSFYNLALEKIYHRLQTNPEQGLSEKEAELRLEYDGLNELPKHKPNFWKVYLAPLFNWLIVIYLIGAAILLIAGLLQTDEETSVTLLYVTLAVVALNCVIAIIQQYRATKKLQALEELTAPTANVIREGLLKRIQSKQLVVGDLIKLEQGNRVPADCRIIKSINLELDESSLTGESESSIKTNAAISEQHLSIQSQSNIVFLGTHITLGTAMAVVVRTGQYSEMGKISKGLKSINMREIPIQKKMNNFGKWLGIAVLSFWVVTFFIIWGVSGEINIFKSLNSAMDIMPINIPLLSTIILITGVLTLAKKGIIIRNLTSVDSLGRISVLCADKTGTITEGKMAVQYILTNSSLFKVTGTGYNPSGNILFKNKNKNLVEVATFDDFPELKQLLISSKLSSNATLLKNKQLQYKNSHVVWKVNGSPTEGALITLYEKSKKIETIIEINEFAFTTEYPFDSSIKLMSKLYNIGSEFILFTKGAPETLFDICSTQLVGKKIQKMTENAKKQFRKSIEDFSNRGYRVISLAQKKIDHQPTNTLRENMEQDLTYLGSVMILDVPRKGVRKAIKRSRDAGIDVKMITGDSLPTATAIARQIGLVEKNAIFARISPVDKHKIVSQLQTNSKIVAMTGDGVNDALALSKADVGISMGIRGTDIAKEAADMVISDDSFVSIIKGITEGRGIFARIRSVVFFYIAINVFEGLVQFFLTIILDKPYFLDKEFYFQWIFLSLTLHAIPGLILTFDLTNKDVINEKPRDSEEILTKNIVLLMICYGILLAASMCLVYFLCYTQAYPISPFNTSNGNFPYIGDFSNPSELQIQGKTLTMLMVTLYFCESILIFQIRRMNKSIILCIKEDGQLWMYILIGVLFSILIVLMYIPGFQTWLAGIKIGDLSLNFGFMRLSLWDWLVCAGIASICIAGFELVKYIFRKKEITF